MASPQIEQGYTRIAHELQEAFCRVNLSPYESRIIRAIERKTFGFGKKEDRISLRQLSAITGLDVRHVHRTVKSLTDRKIVATNTSPGRTSTLGIQKNYELWATLPTVTGKSDTFTGDTCRGDTGIGGETVTSRGNGTVTSRDDNNRKIDNRKGHEKNSAEFSSVSASLRERYSAQGQILIDKAFKAIASTRKSGKVSPSVLLAQLEKWDRYEVEQVQNGIQVYLDCDYASEGKKEDYLLGIVRNCNGSMKKDAERGLVL